MPRGRRYSGWVTLQWQRNPIKMLPPEGQRAVTLGTAAFRRSLEALGSSQGRDSLGNIS